MQHLTAPELAAWIGDTARPQPKLLDVREPREHQTCIIKDSVAIPMNTIPARISELDQDEPIVCICHHGARSMQVAGFLEQNGFKNVSNLTGGIHAWAQQVDRTMPTY